KRRREKSHQKPRSKTADDNDNVEESPEQRFCLLNLAVPASRSGSHLVILLIQPCNRVCLGAVTTTVCAVFLCPCVCVCVFL
uniref:Uncharacterized protein n=1 Tax=Anopheles arabiensis TaxID=7173 RepID=A0A182IGR3_ANOAR